MIRYDRAWRWFWSAVAAIGVGLAVLEWSAATAVITLVLVALVSQLVKTLLPVDGAAGRRWRRLPSSLTIAVAAVTLWSFAMVSPPLVLMVVLAAVFTSPVVVQHLRRSSRRSPPARKSRSRKSLPAQPAQTSLPAQPAQPAQTSQPAQPAQPDGDAEIEEAAGLTPPEELGPLVGLDDRQLCRLWRESFWALVTPAPPHTLLCVVALREACLDELERRHAGALSAWLADGARASSGPEKYLRPGRGGADAA